MNTIDHLRWLGDQGGQFALVSGRTKDKFSYKGWPTTPYNVDDAVAHAMSGGNTGLLVGQHSNGIIAIDRDVDYPQTLQMLGPLGKTVRVERTNAPDRGKLLYRVTGPIPPSTVFKLKNDKHPRCELLSNKRHALVPASEYDGGQYVLRNIEAGILEVTTEQLERIWWLITGESLDKGKRNGAEKSEPGDMVNRVKDAWPTIEVFRRFGRLNESTDDRNGDTRLLGNGGLLVNDWRWYCHSDGVGGDQIDAWSWCKSGSVIDRGDKGGFLSIINEMAAAAGIEPSNKPNQPGNNDQASQSLIDQLATVEDADLKVFALDSVATLAEMPIAEMGKFSEALQGRGVASEWVRRELKPAVNEEKRRKQNGVTWLDYVKAANDLGYEFRLNVLEDALEVNGQRMSTVNEAELLSHLHAKGLRNVDVARRAFLTDANQNHHHPVKDYLQKLQWDGADHIAGLSRYFQDAHDLVIYVDGTQRTVIHAWLLRWLVGAVAKIHNSQEAQNPMLVFDGGQGTGKSYFVKWLCPLDGMHFEGSIRPDDKDYLRYLSTRWIWEVSELGATMRKADREALKAFITLQDVTYRPAHGQYVLHKPALASFIGTVNFEGALLNDPTGHRRFLPVEIVDIDWTYSQNIDVNQVWAQAFHLFKSGVSWKLTDEEKAVHKNICEHYEVEDVLEGHIREWFKIEPENDKLFEHTTTIADKLRTFAQVNITRNPYAEGMRLAATLNKMGLQKKRRENRWGYVGIQFNRERAGIQPSN